jgi:hypothetical protein
LLGDHIQFGDGKAVIRSGGTRPTRSVPDEGYVMAEMWLEINTAGGDLENAAGVVFHNRVVISRATQATLNVGLVCIAARRGSLCKPQRDQQGQSSDQQECSLHGILQRLSPYGGPKFRLGFDSASRFSCRALEAFELRRENLEHPGETTQSYLGKNLTVCSKPLTFARKGRIFRSLMH